MWPPALAFDRICSKQYTFQDFDGKNITINKGENVWVPTMGIHRDERYYPNPTKFDPERFSDENKANINAQAFLPFGSGPRNCIGRRCFIGMKIERFEKCNFLFHRLAFRFDGDEGFDFLFVKIIHF